MVDVDVSSGGDVDVSTADIGVSTGAEVDVSTGSDRVVKELGEMLVSSDPATSVTEPPFVVAHSVTTTATSNTEHTVTVAQRRTRARLCWRAATSNTA